MKYILLLSRLKPTILMFTHLLREFQEFVDSLAERPIRYESSSENAKILAKKEKAMGGTNKQARS